ncbi:hypothetical protein EN742_00770 [Mesorhizobium sp. M4A.F.Ca.ET.020.02.1.1]|uniref:hypothetical protein n=1 Tax=Mesorhizobium sp. M4A.F.Ca.ET.020.02.1.1 TaxID=2496652 RepID=UPI000FD3BA24|nr:hypothetical protein [Mesorhizobium sp. M4A.F.Ca.ET.020.02.1.1]RVD44911.1 hypothetical protein EN742_00770 [Mesorhizobium sp. M4A.F.Ca.ET.020.02.1.1]
MSEISNAPSIAGLGHNLATTGDILRDRFKPILDEVEDLARRATAQKNALTDGAIANDNERDPFVSLGIEARKLAKRLAETKLATTKPLRDEVAETNRFFDTIIVRPETIQSAFETIVGRYDAKKREEARIAAAEVARIAQEEAKRKLDEAASSSHSILGDVLMQEAADAENRAQVLANEAITAASGPTRTEAGTISSTARWTHRITDPAKVPLEKLRPYISIDDLDKFVRAYVRANKNTAPLAGVEIFQDQKTQFRG